MLTQAQIAAENFSTALDEGQVLTLTMLVKQYGVYASNSGLWPNFATVLQAEVDTPTVKTQGLKAVLTQLNKIPAFNVESSKNQQYFSTKANWDTLAQDVLDILFDVAVSVSAQSVAVAQRPVQNLLLHDNTIMPRSKTGRRY